ncbi:MAG TPA: GNAT family N-acetyltransferase [Candidatus Dormibacteraeota bacterium]|nr:GNAT family N-acetyltransferase [Candidatus Dormibacteraeota bacterium]
MARVEIRPARAEDMEGLAATTAGLFAEDGALRDRLRNPGWPAEHGAGWVADLLGDPDALLLAAVGEGSVVGHLVGAFSAASPMWLVPRAELVSMYVRPDHRGLGVGSGLVGRFTAWARDRGAVRLHVTAYADNEGALRFYRRHGFAPLSIQLAADPTE